MLALGDELRAILTRRPPRIRRSALGYVISRARFSTEKARALLGWSPRQSIEEAMETTDRWLRANGHIT
jgi:nucleoside-diphosphate-sugar epimerase